MFKNNLFFLWSNSNVERQNAATLAKTTQKLLLDSNNKYYIDAVIGS